MKLRKETSINNAFTLDSIINVYYLDWEKAMKNSSGSHDVSYSFWQLLYIDRGEYTCSIGEEVYTLSSGQMILAEPNKIRTSISCRNAMVAIINFRCVSEGMNDIKNKAISLSGDDRKLLSRILTTGMDIFRTVPDNPRYAGQQPKDGTADYELQMIKNSLELLLIDLYGQYSKKQSFPLMQNQFNYYEKKFRTIEEYMKLNIKKNITIADISNDIGFSPSTVKRIFSSYKNVGAIHYFLQLKISEAKKLIKETDMSITQISEELGFSSVHYFSRIFKNIAGISPSQYAKSVIK